jgi:hypothetical protein
VSQLSLAFLEEAMRRDPDMLENGQITQNISQLMLIPRLQLQS